MSGDSDYDSGNDDNYNRRVLVAGCRWLDPIQVMCDLDTYFLSYNIKPTIIINGTAAGADTGGQMWAEENNVETAQYSPDWDGQGRVAGPIRNQRMLDMEWPNLVMAYWDGKSAGTKSMITLAVKAGCPVVIRPVDKGWQDGRDEK
jgi:hypothetical protein